MTRSKGFGFFDLMVTLVIASMLVTLAVPAYDRFVSRAKIAKAIGDIGSLSIAIEQLRLNNQDRVPDSLDEFTIDISLTHGEGFTLS